MDSWQGQPACHWMTTSPWVVQLLAGPCNHFVKHTKKNVTIPLTFFGIVALEIWESPTLIETTVGLCDEEPTMSGYEKIAEVATGLARTNDSRHIDTRFDLMTVENKELYLGMNETSGSLA